MGNSRIVIGIIKVSLDTHIIWQTCADLQNFAATLLSHFLFRYWRSHMCSVSSPSFVSCSQEINWILTDNKLFTWPTRGHPFGQDGPSPSVVGGACPQGLREAPAGQHDVSKNRIKTKNKTFKNMFPRLDTELSQIRADMAAYLNQYLRGELASTTTLH